MVLTRRLFQVGSSFELAQRLDDPVDISTLSPSSRSRDDVTPMHVFDIRRSNSVTELWKNIERRSAMLRASAEAPESQPLSSSSPDFDIKPLDLSHGEKRQSGSVNNGSPSDLHRRWVEACNPPRLPSKEAPISESRNHESQENPTAFSSDSGNGTPASHQRETEPAGPSSSITAEGKRQVSHTSLPELWVI